MSVSVFADAIASIEAMSKTLYRVISKRASLEMSSYPTINRKNVCMGEIERVSSVKDGSWRSKKGEHSMTMKRRKKVSSTVKKNA